MTHDDVVYLIKVFEGHSKDPDAKVFSLNDIKDEFYKMGYEAETPAEKLGLGTRLIGLTKYKTTEGQTLLDLFDVMEQVNISAERSAVKDIDGLEDRLTRKAERAYDLLTLVESSVFAVYSKAIDMLEEERSKGNKK